MENLNDPIKYEMKFVCRVCGNSLKESAVFCPKCGNKVNRSDVLKSLEQEELRIDHIMEQLRKERIKITQEFMEKEQQVQVQIVQAESKEKEIRKIIEQGDEELFPDHIRKQKMEYERLEKQSEDNRYLHEEKKEQLESEINKLSDEISILKQEFAELMNKVELSEQFCPVCGIFVGEKRYCGKCGYQMRKEKAVHVVS